MTNPNPYKIKPHERGHRPPLSKDEPTVKYTIRMTKSLKEKCINSKGLAAIKIREFLEKYFSSQN